MNTPLPNPRLEASGLERMINWTWLFQALLFGGGCLQFLLAPRFTLGFLTASSDAALLPQAAVDQVRFIGAAISVAALSSSLGLLMRDRAFRLGMALALAIFITFWSVVFWWNFGSGRYGLGAVIVFALPGLATAALNWVYVLRSDPKEVLTFVDTASSANVRPSSLWTIWLVQGLFYLGWSMLYFWAPGWCFSGLTSDWAEPLSAEDLALTIDQVRMVSPYLLGLFLVILLGMAQQRAAVWREFAWISAVVTFLCGLVMLWNRAALAYGNIALLVVAICWTLTALNLRYARSTDPYDDNSVLISPDGWTLVDLIAGPMMAFQMLASRRRASHLMGVGAQGRFKVVDDPEFPPHPLFSPGAEHPLQARFANLTELDDAALDVRGASLRFSHDPWGSDFDLLMNTGSFLPAKDLYGFASFVASKFVPTWGSKLIIQSNIDALEGAVAGLRRAPESYSRLYFHSQKVTTWVDSDNQRWLVRYRLTPADLGPESGLPSAADAAQVWERARLPSEYRAGDYLRQQLKDVLHDGEVTMRLQARFHKPVPGEALAWYSPALEWSAELPWVDLGEVVLDRALPDPVTEEMTFNPANRPPSLGIPASTGARDPRSLADSEWRVVTRLQRIRLRLYELFGLPRFGDVTRGRG